MILISTIVKIRLHFFISSQKTVIQPDFFHILIKSYLIQHEIWINCNLYRCTRLSFCKKTNLCLWCKTRIIQNFLARIKSFPSFLSWRVFQTLLCLIWSIENTWFRNQHQSNTYSFRIQGLISFLIRYI